MALDFKTNDAFELIVLFDNKTDLKWVDAIVRTNSKNIFKPKHVSPSMLIFPSFEHYTFLSEKTSPIHLRQMFYDIVVGAEEFKLAHGFEAKINISNIFYNKKTEKYELFPIEKSETPAITQLLNLILDLTKNIFVPEKDVLEIELPHAFSQKQLGKFMNIGPERAECLVYIFKQAHVQTCRCFFLILDLLLRCIAEDMTVDISLVDKLTQIANCVLNETPIMDNVTEILEVIGTDILYSEYERYTYEELAVRYSEVLSQLELTEYFINGKKYISYQSKEDIPFKTFIKKYVLHE